MADSKPNQLNYTDPDPLTPEQIRQKLLKYDRDSRLEFMRLTVEPPDVAERLSVAKSRRRRRRRPRPLAA